jgi:hypothetical protein
MTLTPQEYAMANAETLLGLLEQGDRGICLACDETSDCTEGDVENLPCPSCGLHKFWSAEQLMLYIPS